jgi:adenylylsulfate kinase-like enzyme
MVYWITGRSGAGKTTLANRIAKQTNGIVLDGDKIREYFISDFTDEGRESNIMLIAKFAALLEEQGFTVVVACISPKREWRKKAQLLLNECIEICLPFGELWEGTDYEEPDY